MVEVIRDKVGLFKGFTESGLEFKAEIVVPYHTEYHPLLGDFLVVAVSAEEYIVGRVTRFYPMGVLSGSEGDEYLSKMLKMARPIPEDLKEAKLRYNVAVKLLGGIEIRTEGEVQAPSFKPSVRKLPHLGAAVGAPTDDIVSFLCSRGTDEEERLATIGHLALGDMVFDGSNGGEGFSIPFDLHRLVARRTFVFAHAGYGKTNLVKLLMLKLYEREQDVGVLIFDPEGEYAFRDKKGRPGLLDVPQLHGKTVVYTNTDVRSEYKRWWAGHVRLNLEDFRPGAIIANCVPPEKWENIWALRTKGLSKEQWGDLVHLLAEQGWNASEEEILALIPNADQYTPRGIINNIVPVVTSLHDPASRMLPGMIHHLEKGRIVVVDISMLSSSHGRWIASMLMGEIFRRNQDAFTMGSEKDLLKTIVILEEAQSVLSPKESSDSTFVQWAKEGRKYELGGIFITQQPGAISNELLSQGDNFFAYHLLSEYDLRSLQRANAHFSDDILRTLLSEPIPGNSYMWSAPYQPFVLSLRALNFEEIAIIEEGILEETEVTPVEEYAQSIEGVEQEIREAIVQHLTVNPQVALYSKIAVDGEELANHLAFKVWNMLLAVGGSVSMEAKRLECERFPNGNIYLPEGTLLQHFEKMDIEVFGAHRGQSKYFVIESSGLNLDEGRREVKPDRLDLVRD